MDEPAQSPRDSSHPVKHLPFHSYSPRVVQDVSPLLCDDGRGNAHPAATNVSNHNSACLLMTDTKSPENVQIISQSSPSCTYFTSEDSPQKQVKAAGGESIVDLISPFKQSGDMRNQLLKQRTFNSLEG